MAKLNWDYVRYFLALVEAGSLSAAARQLQVEHSTVARRLDQLERQLGVRLFDRMPRGWQLTGDGKMLLEPAKQMQESELRIQRIMDGCVSLSGRVRVSVPPMLGRYLLTPHLLELRKQLPQVELELVSDLQSADLHRREADIALRLHRPEQLDLATRKLADLPFGLFASPAYLHLHAPEQWEFVGYEHSMNAAPQQQWLESQLGARRVVFRSNDLHLLAAAVVQGVGIGVLPRFLQPVYPELQLVSDPAWPVNRELWLVIHPDLRRSPRVRAVADLISSWFV
ncbi:MAG: LysR family transcriptional regulator [Oceanospirillales bacterium]|nr:LysR family transcriptional regulator [Oceanospirillales bacterium]